MGAGAPRLGILGGTFDPPHNGHLAAAANAARQLALDLVLLVVANVPWQKVGEREISPAAVRLAMVEAMVSGVDRLVASDIEIARGGTTYTADTLAEMERRWPGSERWLIVGADVAASLHTWKRLDEVRRGAGLALVERGGDPAELDASRWDGWKVARVRVPRLDVSSSDLRRRVAEGDPLEGLVPASVIRLVEERGLYAGGG